MSDKNNNISKNEDPNKTSTSHLVAAIKYEGPIPHPDIIREYEKILPGAADRILKMAENEQAHEQRCNEKIISDEFRLNILGMIFGFVIAILWLGITTYLLVNNKYIAGSVMGVTGVAVIIGQFTSRRPTKIKKPGTTES